MTGLKVCAWCGESGRLLIFVAVGYRRGERLCQDCLRRRRAFLNLADQDPGGG